MPKILIADDNTNIQKMVVLAFEERGIQVVSVGNGEAAVRRLADLNPDIVLADIFMPVRSGYEVCEYVKKDQRFSHIPVILLIGAFDPLDEKEARRVGADGVLKKPFVPPDPLIAMVMSVLEKNPRVAAEMAKAKEVVAEVPAMPEPIIPVKLEPKPLPEFPEPSAEEAALVYGFGSGRRSVLEEEKDREEASAPMGEDAEEEVDDSASPRDWRRAAMDFEVPEQAGGSPAFSDESFSTERAVAETPVPTVEASVESPVLVEENLQAATAEIPEVPEIPEPIVADSSFAFASEAEAAPASAEPAVAQASEPAAEQVAEPEPAFVDSVSSSAPHEAPIEAEAPQFAHGEETPEATAAESETRAAQTEAPAVFTESGFASNVPHWMDALSAEPSPGGWMAGLSENSERSEPRAEVFAPLALRDRPGALAVISPEVRDAVAVESAPRAPELTDEPQPFASHEAHESADEPANESWFAPAPAAFDVSREAVAAPMAEAASMAAPAFDLAESAASGNGSGNDSGNESGEASGDHHAQQEVRDDYDLAESAPVRSAPEPALEAEDGHFPAPVALRDPDLVEQAAVRVVPEPLLQSDEADLPPRASWFSQRDPSLVEAAAVRVTPEPLLEDQSSQPAPDFASRSFAHAAAPTDSPVPDFAPIEPFAEPEPAQAEAFAEEFSERIPTGPPPNRQALADIPFLAPPPDFGAPAQQNGEMSAEAMDAMVAKIVEKLGPQLQELLSQGVLKPLVENLLQGELAKKNR